MSLNAQRTALIAEVDRSGWELEFVADEGPSAKNMNRPALLAALTRLDRGDADALIAIRARPDLPVLRRLRWPTRPCRSQGWD